MRKILLALLFVAFAVPVVAQQQYGRLEGAARDAQGLSLPGVSVTLSGEAIIGDQERHDGYRRLLPVPGAASGRLQHFVRTERFPDRRVRGKSAW